MTNLVSKVLFNGFLTRFNENYTAVKEAVVDLSGVFKSCGFVLAIAFIFLYNSPLKTA